MADAVKLMDLGQNMKVTIEINLEDNKLAKLIDVIKGTEPARNPSPLREGIQHDFPHQQLRQSGCYWFSLVRLSQEVRPMEYTDSELINSYERHVEKGWMKANCFVKNPIAILNNMSGGNYFSSVSHEATRPPERLSCTNLRANGFPSHFVANIGDKTWDSLPPKWNWQTVNFRRFRTRN